LIDKPVSLIDKFSKANQSSKKRLINQVHSALKHTSFNQKRSENQNHSNGSHFASRFMSLCCWRV